MPLHTTGPDCHATPMSTIQSQEAPTSLLLTEGAAAELLGVSRNTVVRLVQSGALSRIRLTPKSQTRVRRDEVVALAERRG